MAKKKSKAWHLPSQRKPKSNVPETVKAEVESRAAELVENVLKPIHVEPPPKNPQFNYIIDLWTKWHQSYFYFGATYACPGPTAISPTFESKFARLEYVGGNKFALSYMRHTGKWFAILSRLSLNECLELVRDDPHFLA